MVATGIAEDSAEKSNSNMNSENLKLKESDGDAEAKERLGDQISAANADPKDEELKRFTANILKKYEEKRSGANEAAAERNTEEALPEVLNPAERTVISFGKVATGFNYKELDAICNHLRPYLVRYDKENPPEWLTFKFPAHTRPDVVINDLANANVVFEIEASEVIVSADFEMGYTLRFPRIVEWRQDKSFDDAMSLQELQDFMSAERENQRFSLAVGAKRKMEQGKNGNNADGDDAKWDDAGLLTSGKRRRLEKRGLVPGLQGRGRRKMAPQVVGAVQSKISKETLLLDAANAVAESEEEEEEEAVASSARMSPRQIVNAFLAACTIVETAVEAGGDPTLNIDKDNASNAWAVKSSLEGIFAGIEIAVLNCVSFPITKPILERVVLRAKGLPVASFRPGNTHYVLATAVDLRVRNLVSRYDCAILKCDWLLECICRAQRLDPLPRHYLTAGLGIRRELGLNFDRFGDSFTEEMSLEEWERILIPRKAGFIPREECKKWTETLLADDAITDDELLGPGG